MMSEQDYIDTLLEPVDPQVRRMVEQIAHAVANDLLRTLNQSGMPAALMVRLATEVAVRAVGSCVDLYEMKGGEPEPLHGMLLDAMCQRIREKAAEANAYALQRRAAEGPPSGEGGDDDGISGPH
jgi:hypothetical protein